MVKWCQDTRKYGLSYTAYCKLIQPDKARNRLVVNVGNYTNGIVLLYVYLTFIQNIKL